MDVNNFFVGHTIFVCKPINNYITNGIIDKI
jgi:hypothetical protein